MGTRIKVHVLGAGQDIGRSCVVVTLGGRRVMFDCGMHMGYHDHRCFPDWQQLGAHRGSLTSAIDCVVITHFHLDHCGALPFLTEKLGYDGPIYMTRPTAAMAAILLKDSLNVLSSARKGGGPSYSARDVDACLSKVRFVTLGETIHVDDELRLCTHYAGHVVGAVMVSAECLGHRVMYTGDFNTVADRHLGAAQVGRLQPHVLITESTYATSIRESKRCREADLLQLVHTAVGVGGKVLIPSFAVGRAQELLMLLEMYWDRLRLSVPIYVAAGMAQHATLFYKLYASWTSTCVKDNDRPPGYNPFAFRHVRPFERALLSAPGPCVLFATSGMMTAGMALEAFRHWAGDVKNLVLFPSFCVRGTLGHTLLHGAKEVVVDAPAGEEPSTRRLTVACTVKQISFSAHADAKGILGLISTLQPAAVVLVHGEQAKMAYLKVRVAKLFGVPCHDPQNGECLRLHAEQRIAVHISARLLARAEPDASVAAGAVSDTVGAVGIAGQRTRKRPGAPSTTLMSDIEGTNSRRPTHADSERGVPAREATREVATLPSAMPLSAMPLSAMPLPHTEKRVRGILVLPVSSAAAAAAQPLDRSPSASSPPQLQLVSQDELYTVTGLQPHRMRFRLELRLSCSLNTVHELLGEHIGSLPCQAAELHWHPLETPRSIQLRSLRLTGAASSCMTSAGTTHLIRCEWLHGDEALVGAVEAVLQQVLPCRESRAPRLARGWQR
jgi:integrator complex subunit 11